MSYETIIFSVLGTHGGGGQSVTQSVSLEDMALASSGIATSRRHGSVLHLVAPRCTTCYGSLCRLLPGLLWAACSSIGTVPQYAFDARVLLSLQYVGLCCLWQHVCLVGRALRNRSCSRALHDVVRSALNAVSAITICKCMAFVTQALVYKIPQVLLKSALR
jgi:hypothetical protein